MKLTDLLEATYHHQNKMVQWIKTCVRDCTLPETKTFKTDDEVWQAIEQMTAVYGKPVKGDDESVSWYGIGTWPNDTLSLDVSIDVIERVAEIY